MDRGHTGCGTILDGFPLNRWYASPTNEKQTAVLGTRRSYHRAAGLFIASYQKAAPPITSPKAELRFNIGDDYQLANSTQLSNYWRKLARESDRMMVASMFSYLPIQALASSESGGC